jgi:hypothetical protein
VESFVPYSGQNPLLIVETFVHYPSWIFFFLQLVKQQSSRKNSGLGKGIILEALGCEQVLQQQILEVGHWETEHYNSALEIKRPRSFISGNT